MQRNTSRWLMLAIIYLCALAFALVFQSIPPILSLIITDLGISHAQAGLLMSVFALPGIIIAILAGILADRYGVKPIAVFSLLLMIGGTVIVATGHTLPILILGRLLTGTGGIMLSVISPQAVAQWFMHRQVGLAMGLYHTVMPMGTVISLNALAAVGTSWGWRASIWVSTAVSGLALVVFALFFVPVSQVSGKEKQEIRGLLSSLGQTGLPIWLVGSTWACFNAAMMSMFTFAPDFMRESGLNLSSAAFNTSVVMMVSLVVSPCVGYLLDKVGRKEAFIGAGALSLALLLLLVPGGINRIIPLMTMIGIVSSFIPASVYALVPDVVSPERLGVSFGILATVNYLGMFVGPYVVGLSRDMTGSYQQAFGVMSFFAVLAAASIALVWVRRRAKSRLRL